MPERGNMYTHSKLQWNVGVGCEHQCKYCIGSFQKQMRRQKHNCKLCAAFTPHFHPERLDMSLPDTESAQFIWPFSSSDFTFMKRAWVNAVLEVVRSHPDKTFFFQTKDPECFGNYDFPLNTMLGITLETNRDKGYTHISKAPPPTARAQIFAKTAHPRKVITIEPIMEFDLQEMLNLCIHINPERIYIGYDSKRSMLPEPSYDEFTALIERLEESMPECSLYTKYIKIDFWKDQRRLDRWLSV